MTLKDDVSFFVKFTLETIAMPGRILQYFFFTFVYYVLGVDPKANEVFSSVRKPCPYASGLDDHSYRAPGPGDARSPCPALNVMANHGYL